MVTRCMLTRLVGSSNNSLYKSKPSKVQKQIWQLVDAGVLRTFIFFSELFDKFRF